MCQCLEAEVSRSAICLEVESCKILYGEPIGRVRLARAHSKSSKDRSFEKYGVSAVLQIFGSKKNGTMNSEFVKLFLVMFNFCV